MPDPVSPVVESQRNPPIGSNPNSYASSSEERVKPGETHGVGPDEGSRFMNNLNNQTKAGSSVVTSNTLVSKAPSGGSGAADHALKVFGNMSEQHVGSDRSIAKNGGGSGAADHALKVFGDMSAQRAGTDGSIAKNGGGVVPNALQGILPSGGVGLTEALVPVVLVLANNATTKRALRSSGVSQKVINKALPSGGENMPPQLTEGGSLANTIAIPAGLFLASHMVAKSARRTGKNFRKSRKQSDNRRSRRYRRRRR
jgi:hypothetical protein